MYLVVLDINYYQYLDLLKRFRRISSLMKWEELNMTKYLKKIEEGIKELFLKEKELSTEDKIIQLNRIKCDCFELKELIKEGIISKTKCDTFDFYNFESACQLVENFEDVDVDSPALFDSLLHGLRKVENFYD